MKEYIITTDSTVDLPKSMLEEKGVPYIALSYTIDGITYEDRNGLSPKEFFDKIRNGSMPTTSQVNPEQVREMFEKELEKGYDILHIAFSSGLSGTCNSARIAAQTLMEEKEGAKIIVIDSLCACLGQGLLLTKALALKEQGRKLEEVADWVEKNKLHICHNVTVNDLHHLHRGGRVSKATAILGTMVQIKPIIYLNDEGKLEVIGKERGRKKALNRIVDMMENQMKGYEKENDLVMITHGDCIEDAEYVKEQIQKKYGISNVIINNIGTVIGTHTGPGVVATFCMGNKKA
ncbi:DegV family protein [Lachnoclostridium sp. An181]|uniref:DegV family protein n=1 Tax=Lachnoclostridium sp. An181 TaxID=1965575 RepID=UPI000B3A801E|nr:DegV family protein [Lachnoclostridium sp. An181]OUP50586.1 fatty acid-binding protein DegV [Lachnoclostridium sp. An181]